MRTKVAGTMIYKHLMAVTGLIFLLTGCGGGSGSNNDPQTTTDEEMFLALGIDTTDTPRELDGSVLPVDYNPLGHKLTALSPHDEIYLPGFASDAGMPFELLDDSPGTPLANPNLALTEPAPSWRNNELTTSFAADLDGNGIEEIVNIYYVDAEKKLKANIITCVSDCQGNGGNFTTSDAFILLDLNVENTRTPPVASDYCTNSPANCNDRVDWFRAGIIAADVDGDGKDEIVSVGFGKIDVFTIALSASGNTPTLQKTDSTDFIYPGRNMSVASGRFKARPLGEDQERDDLVIASSTAPNATELAIYDKPDSLTTNNPVNKTLSSLGFFGPGLVGQAEETKYTEAIVATGDADDDGLDEILVGARGFIGSPPRHFLFIMESDGGQNYVAFRDFLKYLGGDVGQPCTDGYMNRWTPTTKVFRPDGPAAKSVIYSGGTLIENFADLAKASPSSTTSLPSGLAMNNGITLTYMGKLKADGSCKSLSPAFVAVGDIDGTGKEAIIANWDNNGAFANTIASPTQLARIIKENGIWNWQPVRTGLGYMTGVNHDGLIAVANIDRDSPVVRYVGKARLQFTQPRIIAAVAAPPFFSGANGNSAGSRTIFTFGTGKEANASQTLGISAGYSFSFKTGVNFFGADFSTTYTRSLDYAVDQVTTQKSTIKTSFAFSSGSEDAVVFTVTPMDVYLYKEDSSTDDVTLSINVPRSPIVTSQSVAYYNDNNGTNPDIDASILTHTVGNPASYPDTAGKQMLCSGICLFDSNKTLLVSQGGSGASSGIEISQSDSSGFGTNQTIQIGQKIEVSAGGVSASASVGFKAGSSESFSTSETTKFAGRVGALPDLTRHYDYGMFVYPANLPSDTGPQGFIVVDYWTENVVSQ